MGNLLRPRAVETQIQKALFAKLLRNDDISGIVSHLDVMESELDLIDRQKPQWRDTVGALLKKIIEKDRNKLKRGLESSCWPKWPAGPTPCKTC